MAYRMQIAALAVAGLPIFSTVQARAGDEGVSMPARAYIGAHGGYGDSREFQLEGEDAIEGAGFGGIHAGIDFRSGPLLLGFEVDYDWTKFDGSVSENTFFGAFNESFEVEDLMSLRGRFGYASGKLLLYGTAGYARASAQHAIDNPFFTDSHEHELSGFVSGGGVEYAFSDYAAARVEALHYELLDTNTSSDLHLDLSVIRAGVSLRTGEVGGTTGQPTGPANAIPNFYIGVHGGRSEVGMDTGMLSLDGISGGIHAGAGVQSGNLYWGVEVDYDSLRDVEDRAEVPGFGSAGVEHDFAASVRARFGLTNGAALWYATAGWAWIEATTIVQVPLIGLDEKIEQQFDGLVAGVGVEVKLTENVSGRLEGLAYRLFDEENVARLDFNTIRAGLTYHFNQ